MMPFKTVRSIITPLDKINVDTDQIVPKQFLKLVQRSGFGKYLFYDWRYERASSREDGENDTRIKKTGFVLNDPRYDGSSILVAGENFGCGSSREHAVWALADYGFSVIIAPSFADIFYSNCFKNGVLPIMLPHATVKTIREFEGQVEVSLEDKVINMYLQSALHPISSNTFEIEEHLRQILLEGLDEIAQTLEYEEEISRFEESARHRNTAPPITFGRFTTDRTSHV